MCVTKGFVFAVLIVGVVMIAKFQCAQVNPESLPIRVRRQLPGIPQFPGIPSGGSIPGVDQFKNAGSGLNKNIPGADTFSSSIPRLTRSIPEPAAQDMEQPLMVRFKREARGGSLPTTRTG